MSPPRAATATSTPFFPLEEPGPRGRALSSLIAGARPRPRVLPEPQRQGRAERRGRARAPALTRGVALARLDAPPCRAADRPGPPPLRRWRATHPLRRTSWFTPSLLRTVPFLVARAPRLPGLGARRRRGPTSRGGQREDASARLHRAHGLLRDRAAASRRTCLPGKVPDDSTDARSCAPLIGPLASEIQIGERSGTVCRLSSAGMGLAGAPAQVSDAPYGNDSGPACDLARGRRASLPEWRGALSGLSERLFAPRLRGGLMADSMHEGPLSPICSARRLDPDLLRPARRGGPLPGWLLAFPRRGYRVNRSRSSPRRLPRPGRRSHGARANLPPGVLPQGP